MNYGSGVLGAEVAKKEPSIQAEIRRLEDRVELLHQKLDSLSARLSVVSRLGTPINNNPKAVPEMPLAPMACAISEQTGRVQNALDRLNEIMDCLEI